MPLVGGVQQLVCPLWAMEAPAVDLQTNQGPDADVIVDRKDMLSIAGLGLLPKGVALGFHHFRAWGLTAVETKLDGRRSDGRTIPVGKGSLDLTKRELLAFSGAAARLVVGGGENALAASELKASELRPPTKVSERALPAEQGSCSGGLVVDLWLL